jgi:alkaline phosphatase
MARHFVVAVAYKARSLVCELRIDSLRTSLGPVESAQFSDPFKIQKKRSNTVKRGFLSIVLAATALLSVAASGLAQASAPAKQPNIVIIWGDDIGQSDVQAQRLGCKRKTRRLRNC